MDFGFIPSLEVTLLLLFVVADDRQCFFQVLALLRPEAVAERFRLARRIEGNRAVRRALLGEDKDAALHAERRTSLLHQALIVSPFSAAVMFPTYIERFELRCF